MSFPSTTKQNRTKLISSNFSPLPLSVDTFQLQQQARQQSNSTESPADQVYSPHWLKQMFSKTFTKYPETTTTLCTQGHYYSNSESVLPIESVALTVRLYIQLSILQVETSIGTPHIVDKLQNNQLFLAEKIYTLSRAHHCSIQSCQLTNIMQI